MARTASILFFALLFLAACSSGPGPFPTVTFSPSDGADVAASTDTVTATFGRAIDADTLGNRLALVDADGVVADEATLSSNGEVATLAVDLEPETTYTIVLSRGVATTDGASLREELTAEFTTRAAPVTPGGEPIDDPRDGNDGGDDGGDDGGAGDGGSGDGGGDDGAGDDGGAGDGGSGDGGDDDGAGDDGTGDDGTGDDGTGDDGSGDDGSGDDGSGDGGTGDDGTGDDGTGDGSDDGAPQPDEENVEVLEPEFGDGTIRVYFDKPLDPATLSLDSFLVEPSDATGKSVYEEETLEDGTVRYVVIYTFENMWNNNAPHWKVTLSGAATLEGADGTPVAPQSFYIQRR